MNNLAELKEQIRFWSERNDLSDSQIENFINIVEQDYKDNLFLPPNETIVVLTTDENSQVPIPHDYLKLKHIKVVDNTGHTVPILRKPNEVVVRAGSFSDGSSPSYFERSGSNFIFAPDPGEGQEITLTYYNLIPSLLDTAAADPKQVNYVMAIMPTIYLFGALRYLHAFAFDEDRSEYYNKLYQQSITDLVNMQNEAEMSGSTLSIFPSLSDDRSV